MKPNLHLQDKKIIVLTGIMGSGKTTIGIKLAEKLGFYFIDSDTEIEDRQGKSVNDIFEKDGEKYFRQIEKNVIEEIVNRDENIVLSLGGGAFLDEETRNLIKKKAISIWLFADLDTLIHRISGKNNRPLLKKNKRSILSELIKQRNPTYKTADIHIDTGISNQEFIISNLIKKIHNFVYELKQKKEVINLEIKEDSKKTYEIIIGNSVINDLAQKISAIKNYSKIIILSDQNIANLHLDVLRNQILDLKIPKQEIIIEAGEKSKSFNNLENILEKILEQGIDRKSLLIAFGGGVIGDLGGFIASILLRGIDFIQIPTTLLAAVDSSVGGKTAINSKFGKNLIGSFYQPKLVLCDLDFLNTLPKRDFISGYAEIVKYGLIYDADFFQFLDKNVNAIKNRESEILQKIIAKSCKIKAEIVSQDEKENGIRALLNFGHTFGHIFETETNYSNQLFHGEAVAIGMVMAAEMSVRLGILDKKNMNLIIDHLEKIGLPTSPKYVKKNWNVQKLTSHLYKDKKVDNNKLTFILLKNIGQALIKKDVPEENFLEVINSII